MEQMTAQLLDLGMTGILIGYLIRQNIQSSKINVSLQEKYESLLREAVAAIKSIKP